MRVLTLTNEQVLALADMRECVEELNRAFGLLSQGQVESPIRTRFGITDLRNILLMPSLLRDRNTVSLKVVSVYPDIGGGLPSTRAVVLLVDGEDGELKCVMGGTSLTGIRTGAVSGLSCRYLARKDSSTLAMIGAGGQGFYQISGVISQCEIRVVSVYDPDRGRQKKLVERCRSELHLEARATETLQQATSGADIVVTATTSKTPILDEQHVGRGTHVIAIGAYTPESRELGSSLVSRGSIYVDSAEAAMEEAGDVLIPLKEGAITRASIRGDMAGLVAGTAKGRTSDEEITIFKAVGLAFEDNAVGWMVYARGLASNAGGWLEL